MLSKMRAVSANVTESVPKSVALRILLAASFLLAVFIVLFVSTEKVKAPYGDLQSVQAMLGGQHFDLAVADTPELRIQGLANRPKIEKGQGMLFIFDSPGIECFWMKDVNYSIDILWFSSDKQLVHKEQNVSPQTYPNNFCPTRPAQYVIELPAGTANDLQFAPSTKFSVDGL